MKKKSEVTKTRALKNSLYTTKMMWGMSRRYVCHTVLDSFFGYFMWVFYSAFFMRTIIDAIEKHQSFLEIMQFILLMAGVSLITDGHSAYMRGVINPLCETQIYKKLYAKLYKKARNVELKCFEDHEFYNKYTMAIDGSGQKVAAVIKNLATIFFGIFAAIVVFYTMFDISPFLGNFVFAALLNRVVYKRYQESTPFRRKMEYVNRVLHLADYSKEVRLSGIFGLMNKKYKDAEEGIEKKAKQYVKKSVAFTWLNNIFTYTVIFEGVLIYGAYLALIKGTLNLAAMAVLTTLMTTATFILMDIMDAVMNLFNNGLFIENLRSFLEYKEQLPDNQPGLDPGNEVKSIEFRDVSFSYGDKSVLEHISFTLDACTESALVGHNGAGKSTLIKLLFRLYDPTEGEILLNGINIKEFDLKKYRELFAAAFQDYRVFAMSVRENVMMKEVGEEYDEEVKSALERAGLWDKIQSLPEGLNQNLTREFDDNGMVFSGGEYQKLVAARAFVKCAPVKVFDEPSSALDPIAEYELFESIRKEGEGHLMLFISHRLSSVKNADMVYMLEQGKIIERGTHKDLMKQNGVYANMYKKQAENYLPGVASQEWS